MSPRSSFPVCRALVLLAVLQQLPAQALEPVHVLADLRITGNTTFDAEAIRCALALSPVASRALASAADLGAASDALAKVVAEGYRNAGFADAVVRGEAAAGGSVHLTVAEGKRLHCGPIVVTGNRHLASERVEATLRSTRTQWPGWNDGPAPCGASVAALAANLVRGQYHAIGRWGANVSVACTRTAQREDLATLEVTVRHEGREVRAGKLEIVGDDAERDRVLALVQVPADSVFTTDFAFGLRDRLEGLGRYSGVRLPTPDGTSDRLDPMRFEVLPAPFAQSLADLDQRSHAQLRAALAAVTDRLDAGRAAIEVRIALPEDVVFAGCTVRKGEVVLRAGVGGMLLHHPRVAMPGDTEKRIDVLLTERELVVALGEREYGATTFVNPVPLALTIQTRPAGDVMNLAWGFGVASAGPSSVSILFHPITAAYQLAKNRCRRDGEDLLVQVGESEVRIGPAGELRTRTIRSEYLTITLLEETIEQSAVALRAALAGRTRRPLLGYAGSHVAEAAERVLAAQENRAAALAIVRSTATFLRARPEGDAPPATSERFPIPEPDRSPALREIACLFGNRAALAVGDVRSWPAALAIAIGAAVGGDADRFDAHFSSLTESEETGPLALAAGAALTRAPGLLALAAERCTFEAAFADLGSAAPAGSSQRRFLDALAAHWRQDPALAGLLPAAPADDFTALRAGAKFLWDAGAGELVRAWIERR